MRLLRRQENGEFRLYEFFGDEVPPYAILSHTWGSDEDEVTFEDLSSRSGVQKPGYSKIRLCADQAEKDGLRYFWIDTCNIDKKSSAELSEAINCMFRWYENAIVCYVYLKDVTQENFSLAFPQSRWFTRGWTLQELIAPSKVLFFAADGTRLGDKTSLCHQIQKITNIPVGVLQGRSLQEYSTNERMSWAKGRSTRRPEDAVYSLFGLVSINMPLIYGEGYKGASKRLHIELSREFGSSPIDFDDLGARLYSAASMGNVPYANKVLKEGASINWLFPPVAYETALHAAVRHGSLEILNCILAARPLVDAYSRQGITPLMLAAIQGNEMAVKRLLDEGSFPDFRVQAVRSHLVHNIGLKGEVHEGSTPLILAAQNGHAKIVDILLAHGSDIEARTNHGCNALNAAAAAGHTDCVITLAEKGADVHTRVRPGDFTVLMRCANKGDIPAARAVLAAGADIEGKKDEGAMNSLLEAAWLGRAEFVEFIVQQGADPTAQANWGGYYNGFTALHVAVEDENLNVIQAAFSAGVPLDIKSGAGQTALELAEQKGTNSAAYKKLKALSEASLRTKDRSST
ncbi:ankyrin repeat-containing domain protein [Phaeosphaeriaceae sp. PMI808]|nr:ankyrin repeat-containing domain protein [Phaeosphaeriaceae sp. PMI808]